MIGYLLSFLHAKQFKVSQPFLVWERPLIISVTLLDSLVLFEWRSPELDAVYPHQGRAEEEENLFWHAGHTLQCVPEYHCSSWPQGHTAGTWSTCCPPGHLGPPVRVPFQQVSPYLVLKRSHEGVPKGVVEKRDLQNCHTDSL